MPVIFGDPISEIFPVPFGASSRSRLPLSVVILGLPLPLSDSIFNSAVGGSPGPMLITFWVPKLVTPGMLVIPGPNELPLITVTPLILNSFPLARFMCSEEVQACAASAGYSAVPPRPFSLHINTWSVVPFRIRPPPSAIVSEFDPLSPVCASVMYLSSTASSVSLITDMSPSLITRLPLIVTFPSTSMLPPTFIWLSENASYIPMVLVEALTTIACSCVIPLRTSIINCLSVALLDNFTLPLSTVKLA